jgi:hypothetical protein
MQNTTSDQKAQLAAHVQDLFQQTSVQEIEQCLWDMFNRTVENEDATMQEVKDAAFYCRLLTRYLHSMQLYVTLQ